MGVGELRRLKQLEDENWCLKGLVADLTLDKHILQEVLKKVLRPVRRRELVNQVVEGYEISRQRACRDIAAKVELLLPESPAGACCLEDEDQRTGLGACALWLPAP